MRVYRFPMRPRKHPEAAVFQRCRRQRKPDADLRLQREVKIIGILMPWLANHARILENELALETIDVRTQQIRHDVDDARTLGHTAGRAFRMAVEHFGDAVFGIDRIRTWRLFVKD